MAKHSRPDVAAADAVERSIVSVKMTGNITALNSPIDSIVTPATGPPATATTIFSGE